MGYAGGRAAMAAGGGLTSIGGLLMQLAQQKQAEQQRANDPMRRLQIAVAEREAADRGIFRGAMPENFEPAPVEEIAPAMEVDPRLAGGAGGLKAAPAKGGMGVNPEARGSVGLGAAGVPLPKISRPEPAPGPQGEFSPDPDFMPLAGGEFYARTPDAQAEYERNRRLAPIRNHIGIIAGSGTAIDTPEEQDAAAALMAEGFDVERIRSGVAPQAPVPGTPEWETWFRKQQEIIGQYRKSEQGRDLSSQQVIGLRQAVDDTRKAVSNLQQYKGESNADFAARKDAIYSTHGWRNRQEFEDAAQLIIRTGMGALGASAPSAVVPPPDTVTGVPELDAAGVGQPGAGAGAGAAVGSTSSARLPGESMDDWQKRLYEAAAAKIRARGGDPILEIGPAPF